MKIAVLTSSRADFGIYLPLLQRLDSDPDVQLDLIAFGTHLSKFHGFTLDEIKKYNFSTIHEISTLLTNDDEDAISTAYGLTALKFADFWKQHQYEWVLCLGDRFEMAAAVQAGIPFGVKYAHLHGGETTLGAIDNVYRHQITLASTIHFPSTEAFAQRINELTATRDNIFVVGSLSIDQLSDLDIPSEGEFRRKYDIEGDFALLTFHPETVSPHKNRQFAKEMRAALSEISENIKLVITMPNADTFGTIYRKELFDLKESNPDNVILIENFGKLNYFAAMTYCKLLIGNTSSGIIEAASFGKYVVNVGDRQKGRAQSENIIDVSFDAKKIIESTKKSLQLGSYIGSNIYQKNGTVGLILNKLKGYKK